MTPTADYVQERIAHYNALIFRGELPPIPVKTVRARTFLGKVEFQRSRRLFAKSFVCSNFLMKISVSHDYDDRLLDNVIVHEMIHYYIAFKGLRDTSAHGELFRRMMADINSRYGLDIRVSHRVPDSAVAQYNPRQREHVVCVSQLLSGDYGVTVCSKACAPKIKRDLPRYFRLKSMTWYVTKNQFFNRYPHSRSAKIYKITAEELAQAGIDVPRV